MKNDLSSQILCVLGATELALNTEQATLGVIGSKWSYALKWCKLNNDDDADDDDILSYVIESCIIEFWVDSRMQIVACVICVMSHVI